MDFNRVFTLTEMGRSSDVAAVAVRLNLELARTVAHMIKPVLVVEDDRDCRDSLVDLLCQFGFEVRSACNGEEALQLLKRMEAPCLILLDLAMPVMDGEEFRARQLADPVLAKVPVILISADTELREKAERLKVEAAIGKPFDAGLLLATMSRHWNVRL